MQFWKSGDERPRRRKRQHGRRLPSASTSSGTAVKRGARRTQRRRPQKAATPRIRLGWVRPVLLSLLGRGGRRAFAGMVVLALSGLAFWGGRIGTEKLTAHPAFAVREVEWVGAEHADVAELETLADVQIGDHWAGLDLEALRFRVEAHPWVARAHVRRPWVGKVRILIEECEAVAFVNVDGQRYGLCLDLRLVPVMGDEGDLPVIRDFASGRKVDPETLARGLEYVTQLRELGFHDTLHLDLRKANVDVILLPDRGFSAEVEAALAAPAAARSVAAFLETLDAEGGQRGTLRLISKGTAVWKASA